MLETRQIAGEPEASLGREKVWVEQLVLLLGVQLLDELLSQALAPGLGCRQQRDRLRRFELRPIFHAQP